MDFVRALKISRLHNDRSQIRVLKLCPGSMTEGSPELPYSSSICGKHSLNVEIPYHIHKSPARDSPTSARPHKVVLVPSYGEL